jgi:hypothetical protein
MDAVPALRAAARNLQPLRVESRLGKEHTMKGFGAGHNHFGLKTDLQRGVLFILLTSLIFGALIMANRPHWAGPWLIASVFTFAVWRLGRQPSNRQ